MSYKSLTVCLDNSTCSSQRLEFALSLVLRHDAHLTALHMTYAPLVFEAYGDIAQLFLEWEDLAKEKQAHAKAMSLSSAQNVGIDLEWAGYRSSELTQVIAHARASDLTIMAQRDPAGIDTDVGNGFNEVFVLKLGRPVLFLPYARPVSKTFDSIVVAWDGGREAARAMADALPILKQAQQVKVLRIVRKSDDDSDLPDVDIATYLARHDVKVEIEKKENIATEPAEWLLSRANDVGADLLVMGAYGHSRLGELVLGGVTRSILRKMTLPVLMSH